MKRAGLILITMLILTACSMHNKHTGSIHAANKQISAGVFTEVLEQSEITVATPAVWNGKLLLLAHGLRPEESALSSGFSMEDPFYKTLLQEGWIIGSTSYRRNGIILQEAIEDIEILRLYLEKQYGKPSQIYLQGSSMGATIGTLIAENPHLPYTGILAIGLPQTHRYKIPNLMLSFQPKIPILFLSNRTETEAPTEYRSKAKALEPAVWIIDRDGHCKVNSTELALAFDALLKYADTNVIVFEKDGTVDIEPTKSLAEFKDGAAFGKVIEIHPSYGNFISTLSANDMTKLGINKDSYFIVGSKQRYFRIFYGSTYSDVIQGYWVAFINAEGYLRIARNFANAAEMLHCGIADEVYIRPLPENESIIQPYIILGTDAVDLGIEAWDQLLAGNPEKSIKLGEESLLLNPELLWVQMNLAHAYLVKGNYNKAVGIYKKNIGKHIFRQSFYFEDIVLDDLKTMEEQGLKNFDFDKIRELIEELAP